MSYEATIVCDRCSGIIGSGYTAADVREENRQAGGASRPPHDLCQRCVTLGHRLPSRETSE